MTHPEEQLAAYVDGTLSDQERAEVDAHLASCQTCRDEVELAGRARSVLASLPALEVPPDSVRPGITRLRPASGERFRRTGWVAGLAAAAAVAAIFGMIVLSNGGGGGGGAVPSALGVRPAEQRHLVEQPNRDYDRAQLRALAGSLSTELAQRTRRTSSKDTLSAGGGTGQAAGTAGTAAESATAPQATPADQGVAASGSSAPTTYSGFALRPTPCLRQGAGLAHGARPVQVIVAKYRGVPAYIGAFVVDGGQPETLVLYVVARNDCRQLSSLQQAIR